MANISKIKPGQVLWSVVSQRMGNTTISRKALFQVKVVSVDPELKWVEASWNGNPPRRFYPHNVSGWKVNKPEPKGKIMGLSTY